MREIWMLNSIDHCHKAFEEVLNFSRSRDFGIQKSEKKNFSELQTVIFLLRVINLAVMTIAKPSWPLCYVMQEISDYNEYKIVRTRQVIHKILALDLQIITNGFLRTFQVNRAQIEVI